MLTGRAEDGRSYALLVDGTTLTIRLSGPGDYEAVKRLHEAMSLESLYFRFFSASRVSAEREARRVCLEGRPGMVALVGLLGGELVGVASYEFAADGAVAEAALAVADGMHRRGIATLLLEHLVSLARARGVTALTAEVLADNYAVLHVLTDSGLALRRRWDDGVAELSIPVPRVAALGEAGAGNGVWDHGRMAGHSISVTVSWVSLARSHQVAGRLHRQRGRRSTCSPVRSVVSSALAQEHALPGPVRFTPNEHAYALRTRRRRYQVRVRCFGDAPVLSPADRRRRRYAARRSGRMPRALPWLTARARCAGREARRW